MSYCRKRNSTSVIFLLRRCIYAAISDNLTLYHAMGLKEWLEKVFLLRLIGKEVCWLAADRQYIFIDICFALFIL